MQFGDEAFLLNEVLALVLLVSATTTASATASGSHIHGGDMTFLFHLALVRRQLLLRVMLLRRRLVLLRRLVLRRRLMLLLLQQMRLEMVMGIVHHFGGGPGQVRRRRWIMSDIHLRKSKDGDLMHQERWRIQRADGVWGFGLRGDSGGRRPQRGSSTGTTTSTAQATQCSFRSFSCSRVCVLLYIFCIDLSRETESEALVW